MPYSYSTMIADVWELADAFGFGKFHLVGHDHGAGLGWVAAADAKATTTYFFGSDANVQLQQRSPLRLQTNSLTSVRFRGTAPRRATPRRTVLRRASPRLAAPRRAVPWVMASGLGSVAAADATANCNHNQRRQH